MHVKGMSNFWTSCYNRSRKFSLPWFYSRRSGFQISRESLKKMALQCATALIISILVIPVKNTSLINIFLAFFWTETFNKEKKLYNVRKENLRWFERLLYHVYGYQSFSSKTHFFAAGFCCCCCWFFFIKNSTNVTCVWTIFHLFTTLTTYILEWLNITVVWRAHLGCVHMNPNIFETVYFLYGFVWTVHSIQVRGREGRLGTERDSTGDVTFVIERHDWNRGWVRVKGCLKLLWRTLRLGSKEHRV